MLRARLRVFCRGVMEGTSFQRRKTPHHVGASSVPNSVGADNSKRHSQRLRENSSGSRVLFAGPGQVGLESSGGVEAGDDRGGDDLAGFDVRGKMHSADEAALFVFFGALGKSLGAVGVDAG